MQKVIVCDSTPAEGAGGKMEPKSMFQQNIVIEKAL